MSAPQHALDAAQPPQAILASLPAAARELVQACHVLFAGDWDDLAEDCRRRQAGQPYLFKLQNVDPADALDWIHQLQTYEAARGESLADALPAEESS